MGCCDVVYCGILKVWVLCCFTQADVFSFGILMYMVLTGGQHPFEELDFQNERDKSFADVSIALWCALFALSAISTRVLFFSLTPIPRRPVGLG